jgi:molybdopterin biosynthesis enzyme MoaB
MEYIRLRSAERIPTALLSRSVAAVLGNTLVYTLPGNPRAVQDYMAVIRQTLQHLLYVLQGLDVHG